MEAVASTTSSPIAKQVPRHHPLKIGLVQINNSFSMAKNYLPYSIALLQTLRPRSSRRNPERYEFLTPLYKAHPDR